MEKFADIDYRFYRNVSFSSNPRPGVQVHDGKVTNRADGRQLSRGWWLPGGWEEERLGGPSVRRLGTAAKTADTDAARRRRCTCDGFFPPFFFLLSAAMSKRPSRSEALDDISAWDTEEVLRLLRKVSQVRLVVSHNRWSCVLSRHVISFTWVTLLSYFDKVISVYNIYRARRAT